MAHVLTSTSSGVYACPRTHAPLNFDEDGLRTHGGDAAYPVRAGIPRFLSCDEAEGDAGRARLDRLNEEARRSGWETALRSSLADDPDLLRYVSDPLRARFVDLLPLGPEVDVLEIGPGLGQITQVLAQRSRSVCALEVVPGQAQFVAQRCAQQGLQHVHVAVGGDDGRLPYPDGRFHVAVLNLVFEWCASRCPHLPEIDVQRRLLGEMARVLAPGGMLYLSTKNRYALKYLIGKTDEHFHDMRFGNALPRALGRWLLRRRGHDRAGGVLYSHRALSAMLRDAGYADVRSVWAAPEIRYPAHYIPTDAASVRAARKQPGFVQGETRSTRLLMQCIPAPLVKHVTPGLTFLATKGR